MKRTSHIDLAALAAKGSQSFRNLNPQLFGQAPVPATPAAITIRQSKRKVSLLEERWNRELRLNNPDARIYEQFPLALGTGCNYYVDFLIVYKGGEAGLRLLAHEVKGWRRSTGIAKLKVAARLYPWITFFLVTEATDGRWHQQEIFP